jgi:hypothetical protein
LKVLHGSGVIGDFATGARADFELKDKLYAYL